MAGGLRPRDLPQLRDPSPTYYRLAGTGRAARPRGAAPARAAPADDAQQALAPRRGADRRLRARAPWPGAAPISAELRRPRWGGIVVSLDGVWRCLQPAWARHPPFGASCSSQATALPTSRRASPNLSVTSSRPSGRACRRRLLLRRTTARHQGHGLAADRDRRRLLRSSGPQLVACPQRPAGGRRTPRGLPGASQASSRQPAGGSSACSRTTAASFAAPSPRRSPRLGIRQTSIHAVPATDERGRRGAAQDHPRRGWRPAFARFLYLRFQGL